MGNIVQLINNEKEIKNNNIDKLKNNVPLSKLGIKSISGKAIFKNGILILDLQKVILIKK